MNNPTNLKRLVRRDELLKLIPMSDATIYQLEKAGKFPKRFHLTPRCAVWDLEEIETWIAERRAALIKPAPPPNVRQRKFRPVQTARPEIGKPLK